MLTNNPILKMLTYDSLQKEQINLKIGKEWIAQVTSFLITQDIPFHLNYSTLSAYTPPQNFENAMEVYNEKKAAFSLVDTTYKIASITNKGTTPLEKCIKDAYHKYITHGLINVPPSQNKIAAEFGISMPTFKSYFKALYGKTFYQVYLDKKMEYAAQLLKQGYKAVDVSKRVGYGEKSCIKFNKMFQKHFGMTPKKYQMNQK